MNPETEIRTLTVAAPEPEDRTIMGAVACEDNPFDFGTVDTTDEARELPVRVFWWRVKAMNDSRAISNVRIRLDGAAEIPGNIDWYLDVTDIWNPSKTAMHVMTGSPGRLPLSEPEAATVAPMSGDEYTGTGHGDTSKYIYISGKAGINVPVGALDGLRLRVEYDWK